MSGGRNKLPKTKSQTTTKKVDNINGFTDNQIMEFSFMEKKQETFPSNEQQ